MYYRINSADRASGTPADFAVSFPSPLPAGTYSLAAPGALRGLRGRLQSVQDASRILQRRPGDPPRTSKGVPKPPKTPPGTSRDAFQFDKK